MASEIIATVDWTAGGYDYTLDVEEIGGSADSNDLSIISPITVRRGDPNYGPLEPVLESVVSFRLRDAALYLRGQFASAGPNKHLINIARDSDTFFRGYIDTRFQSYLAWKDNPEFEVTAFDGLALLDGFPWLRAGDETLREQLFAILDLTGLDLPINIVMPWKHDGADSSTEPPDALRWRSEDWLDEDSTYGDALRALCSAFDAQCFQRLGEWWFVQRAERGASMTVYPTDNTGAADTAYTYDPDYTATDAVLLRDVTEVIEYPITSLVTIKQRWIDRGLRNGGFELLNSRYWEDGGTGALATASGGWTMDTNGDYVEQEVGHTLMAVSGTRDKLVVHLDFSMEVDASASGTGTVGNAFLDYLEIKLIEADGTVLYDDGVTGGSNAWTGTPTYVQYPFLLAASAGTTVSETDLKWTTPVVPSSPCKIIVKFIFQSNPNSDGDYINSFTINRAWVYHARPDAEDDIERPAAFTYAQGNTLGGDHLEQEFILGDMYDRHITPGVMQYYDGADWQFTTDWNGSGQKFHQKRLADIVAQVSDRVPGYVFGHLWGEDVDALSSVSYDPDGDGQRAVFLPVFEERIIHLVGKHSVRTAAYQLLGAVRVAGINDAEDLAIYNAYDLALSDAAAVSSWPDSSANSRDMGSPSGTVNFYEGTMGPGASVLFSTTGAKLEYAARILPTTGEWSVFTVYKTTDANAFDGIWTQGNSAGSDVTSLHSGRTSFNGKPEVVNGSTTLLTASTAINDGDPHLVEIHRSATNWYLYVDGVLEDTYTGNDAPNVLHDRVRLGDRLDAGITTVPLSLGLVKFMSGIPSAGRLAEIRAYCAVNFGVSF